MNLRKMNRHKTRSYCT